MLEQLAQVAPSTEHVAWMVLGLYVGLGVPVYEGQERVRGFSRALLSKLPYEPPPGVDAETALRGASQAEYAGTVDDEE